MAAPVPGFGRRFLPLALLGLAGIAALGAAALADLDRFLASAADRVPPGPFVVALVVAQPALLVLAATAIGAALAHRYGFVSVLAHRTGVDRFAQSLVPAVALGVAVALASVAADLLVFRALAPAFFAAAEAEGSPPLRDLLVGVLYGGIAEELMLRWGAMTLFVALGARVFAHRGALPRGVVAAAAVLSALLFAAGHLPAAAAVAPLTGAVVVRTLLLNGVAGLVFAAVYARYTIESAMVAHASAHVALFAASLAGAR